jgi:DNA-binding transcriptional ArsR family regulator
VIAMDHDAVFQALADPTRRRLLRTLSASGPATLTELSAEMPVSRQAISKHLVLLQDAGLIVGRGEVRGRRYEITPAPLADAMGWIVEVGAGWDDRLARLKEQVEGRQRERRPPSSQRPSARSRSTRS